MQVSMFASILATNLIQVARHLPNDNSNINLFETFKKIVSFRSCCTSRNFSCYIAPEIILAEVNCMISQAWRSECYCQRELGYIVAWLPGSR